MCRVSGTTILACALALVLIESVAHADSVTPSEYDRRAITRIYQGVFQFGISDTLIMTYVDEADDSSFRVNLIQSVALRYFVRDNIAVSLHPGIVYRKAGEVRDLGFQGVVWGNFYFRLGKGIFLVPGAGLGGFRGQRDIPLDDTNIVRSTVLGVVAGVEMPLVVFVTRSFSVKGGPEFLLTAGGSTPEDGESSSYLQLDGAFKVGLDYSF